MSIKTIWYDALQCETCLAICHAPSGCNGEFTRNEIMNAFFKAHLDCKKEPEKDAKLQEKYKDL